MSFHRFSSVHYGHYAFNVYHLICARAHTDSKFAIWDFDSLLDRLESSTKRNHHYDRESIKNMHNYYSLYGIWAISNVEILNLSKMLVAMCHITVCTHKWICLCTRSFIRLSGWLLSDFIGSHNITVIDTCRTKAKMSITVMQFIYTFFFSSIFNRPFSLFIVRIFLFIYIAMKTLDSLVFEVHWCLIWNRPLIARRMYRCIASNMQ